jgi:RNA polymerase subunit RPABC4/transcription elongation factor Spt4
MTSNNRTNKQVAAGRFDMAAEVRLIPAWAWVLAVLVYLGIQLLFHTVAWPGERNAPGRVFQVLFPLFMGVLPAFFVLLIGYVNVDAGRRGMSRALWTVIVIFVPNAIGFIIYFLVRQPIRVTCPQCGTGVSASANFCPVCAYGLRAACPHCKAPLGEGDTFCTNCGSRTQPAGDRNP